MKSLLCLTSILFLAFHAPAQNSVAGKHAEFATGDRKPEYPGGTEAIKSFLTANLVYPPSALKNDKEGRVIVRFVIDTFGRVSDVSTINHIYPPIDSEAVRVVNKMNGWKPGIRDGRKVKVSYTIPITFTLPK